MSFDPRDQRISELEQMVADRDAQLASLQAEVTTLQSTVTTLHAKIQELEDRLNRNSSNSSLPPSANPPGAPKHAPKKPTGRKRGGQPGHKGHHRAMADPDETRPHRPECCRHCQGAFNGTEAEVGKRVRHQVAEIPPVRPFVTEHQLLAVQCTSCGQVSRAALPEGVPTGQFGPRLVALAALLSGRYRISRRELTSLFQEGFGLKLSVGSAQALCERAAEALEKPYEEIAKEVLAQPVIHADETSHPHQGKKHWLWMVASKWGAVFRIDRGRGREARNAILPDDYGGTVVSDRWHVYDAFERRQLCHAHLLRNWRAVSERKHPSAKVVGEWGIAETLRLLELHRLFREGELTREGLVLRMRVVKARYARLLNMAEDSGDKKAMAMAKGLNEKWAYLWTCVTTEDVDPTNNRGEREIRPAVIWRKSSLGTQSDEGQRFVERILSVSATAKTLGVSIFVFLIEACEAMFKMQPAPSIYAQVRAP